ncbi:hypothetical protein [Pedobacter sp. B4-66]|uniref:hypothetical protein n=1 Tax=Pedobacter sp. B4-66 TaxID=2817280 RepID=UPI001BD91DE0|nr:hypothetical protein [Pedobacter sp. B4-66]
MKKNVKLLVLNSVKIATKKKNLILRNLIDYEFRLSKPKNINKDNKIAVHFFYLNPAFG